MTESFSLLDRPWILTMLTDGSTSELSLREIFDGSHSVASIRGDSPLQDAAIYRLLLAIYWCAHRDNLDLDPGEELDMVDWIPERLESAAENQADDTVLDYLDRHADRFDLLDSKKPFMQVADLHTSKNATADVRRIVPEFEDDYFTLRAGNGALSLAYAEAARWLVYIQAYDYSGIKSGAVGDPRVKGGRGYPIGTGWTGAITATIILGSNLQETLVLNTTDKALQAEDDHPVWEREPDTSAQRIDPANKDGIYPKGPAEILTWQSRRVRLFPEDGVITQVLVSNGDRIPKANANVKDDPMTPYRFSKNKSTRDLDVYYPKPLEAQRTMWRSLEPLIALKTDPIYDKKNRAPERPKTIDQLAYLEENGVELPKTLNVSMASMQYGSNSSVVDISISTRIELPLELLPQSAVDQRQAVLNLAAATSQAGTMLGSFAGQLFQAAGGEYEFQPAATDNLLAELEPKFSEWMKTLHDADLEPRLKEWELTVHNAVLQHADVLLVGAGPKALIGRIIENNGDERFVSAGTVMSWLRKKLREILPRTVPR
ncbi:type I-E CRISPR-associated protein Cse1/CasA [uncultured Corynebacterium sp.]|uniref:type I-E CRISPR-associated protein Cse1/CasA n=1 Tax=uncultured Corynebacterium sp. TaxID=159447 RepID=UPI0026340DE0|nr:type I-E CRISPR-associated protein Cse1/CasA [uncultured Corynebacterium sp.]